MDIKEKGKYAKGICMYQNMTQTFIATERQKDVLSVE